MVDEVTVVDPSEGKCWKLFQEKAAPFARWETVSDGQTDCTIQCARQWEQMNRRG